MLVGSLQSTKLRRRHAGAKLLCVVLAALLLAAACGDDDDAPTTGGVTTTTAAGAAGSSTTAAPSNVEPVKVGVVLSASGAVAQIGQAGMRSLAGFEKCWTFKNGGKIDFEIINDASDPTQAVAGVDTLVEEDVVALMGFSGSAFAAAFPRLLETKIPVVFIPPLPYPNFNKEKFIFSSNIPLVATQFADFIEYGKALGLSKMAVLTTDDAQGDALAALSKTLNLHAQQVPNDVTNYQPILSELRSQGYDGLITSAPSGAPPAFIAQSKKALGWDVDQFLSPSNLTADFVRLAGDAADGARGFVWPGGLGSEYFKTSNPAQAAAVAEAERCLPNEDLALDPTIGFYWDTALSIAMAVDAAGSTDPTAVATALENLEFYGTFGYNKRTPTDHVGYKQENAVFGVLQDGKVIPAPDAKRGG